MTIGAPNRRCPVRPRANGTLSVSQNSTKNEQENEYFQHLFPEQKYYFFTEFTQIFLTRPTEEKNSSKSLGLIVRASCIQNIVLMSRSSGVNSAFTSTPLKVRIEKIMDKSTRNVTSVLFLPRWAISGRERHAKKDI
uniref:Uncharacterized protein n=1 Tax=Romanomermis culicivorax TaxID=13658 RepID=A0A915ISJ6_ROMCU